MPEVATFARKKRIRSASCRISLENVEVKRDISTKSSPTKKKMSSMCTRQRNLKKSGSQSKKLTQMFLDVGQKNFFSTTCPECGFVYTPGKHQEERLHLSHHRQVLSLSLMKFSKVPPGSSLIMDDGNSGSIYKMHYFKNSPGNMKSIMVSISDLLTREMGTCDGWIENDDAIIYLYLNRNKEMVGCIILEVSPVTSYEASLTETEVSKSSNDQGLPGIVIGNKEKSKQKKSQCAVRLIWTSQSCRRKKIGTKLLDCARAQLISGQIIPRENVAFSQPSQEGGRFIRHYTGSSEFLVYEK